jgi:hypothetical protein
VRTRSRRRYSAHRRKTFWIFKHSPSALGSKLTAVALFPYAVEINRGNATQPGLFRRGQCYFFLHPKSRIVWSWSRTPIREILKRGWLFDDPGATSVLRCQIRFAKRLKVFDFSFRARHQGHEMLSFVGLISVSGLERYFVGSGFLADLSCVEFGSHAIRDLDHQHETW